MERNRNYFYQ